MSTLTNTTNHVVVFRDDCPDKHFVKPGDRFEVVGDQHLVHVATLLEQRDEAEQAPAAWPPARRTRQQVVAALAAQEPEDDA